jgi:hypothetical protein
VSNGHTGEEMKLARQEEEAGKQRRREEAVVMQVRRARARKEWQGSEGRRSANEASGKREGQARMAEQRRRKDGSAGGASSSLALPQLQGSRTGRAL